MNIELSGISKRYTNEWILRNVDYQFQSNRVYGVQGANGSGKSTLMKIISGFLSPTVGTIVYSNGLYQKIERDEIYRSCSFWGPHVGLFAQLTVDEMIQYYFSFKNYRGPINAREFRTLTDLPVKGNRSIQSLSSGQTQRLGLALTILADSELLLLDEPGSFLDVTSLRWFTELLDNHKSDRLIIISSNEKADLELAQESLRIEDFK